MFGRDSIFTSLQALPFNSELAATTLRELGLRQGTRIDDFRDEDPGRILHEMRYGEMTAFGERPHSPYYGNADATPLYLVLLDEYERWTGDTKLVREFEHEARAALNWIDDYGDLPATATSGTSDGTRRPASRTSAGRTPGTPSRLATARSPASRVRRVSCRATPTTPRYAGAPGARDLARRRVRGRPREAGRGSQAPLQPRLLDRRRRVFRARARRERRTGRRPHSNNGHLLWSGIVDKNKAKAVVRHLMGPRCSRAGESGRSAESEGRYNPIGYHVGTVWPFDNSFIAWGLRRYGYKEQAAQIAPGSSTLPTFFDGRLPEAFGGYPRDATKYPVQYPTACSPQAWSTGTPLLLLRTLLGLEPTGDHLIVDPLLPAGMGQIELLDIPGRWGHIDQPSPANADARTPGSCSGPVFDRRVFDTDAPSRAASSCPRVCCIASTSSR